ncbi:MAG TPA: hypothetical protein VMG12_06425 [Polyangiaceae bacterium]|nr:hypothetical protein [Polyangiaceae bacterium]
MSSPFTILSALGIAGALASAIGFAAAPGAAAEGPRRGPPPEAIAACEDLDAGDACQVTLGDRSLDGTCETTREGELACRPARGSGPPRPPPEAVTACADLDAGDACQVSFGEHTIDGTCEAFDGKLACKPSGPPPEAPPEP